MIANLARAIDFVKFGEAKNGLLLTFTSAWMLASANVALSDAAAKSEVLQISLTFGGPLLAISAALALISFLPQVDLAKLRGTSEPNPQPNYLFFEHLSCIPADGLPVRFAARYITSDKANLNEAYHEDLGCQISANSKIASRKFRLFRWGLRFLAAALFIYAVGAARLAVLSWCG